MPRFQLRIETAFPILFLSDPSPETIWPDNADTVATATLGCICFHVLSRVDGASLVTVTDEDCGDGGMEMFRGIIDAPDDVLTVMDSELFRYLNIPVPRGRVPVSIWADDGVNPDWIWIQLGAIRQGWDTFSASIS